MKRQSLENQPTGVKPGISGLLLGVLAGAVIAGVAVLLFTPRSGKDTVAMIKDRSARARNAVVFHVKEAARQASHNGHKK